eukprot:356902-Chlamydomonas_euryale.AAC.13
MPHAQHLALARGPQGRPSGCSGHQENGHVPVRMLPSASARKACTQVQLRSSSAAAQQACRLVQSRPSCAAAQ